MSLVARFLEENGLPTVMIANARDIVEYCGVPRLLYTDFPLGNPVGVPGDADMQREVVAMALTLLETADGPRTTVDAPFVWPRGDEWKAKIFTEEQPFLDKKATERWLKDKAEYRQMKSDGKL